MNKIVKLLDHGSIKLIDMIGSDSSIVQTVRISHDIKNQKDDISLIRYLMSNEYLMPFETVRLKFHIVCPIFVARQWMRHRTANYNEYSARYSSVKDDFYIPEYFRNQNTQGINIKSAEMRTKLTQKCKKLFKLYYNMIDMGICREQARIILPVNTYTEFYWSVDLRTLFNFIKLRANTNAQYEIQVYAFAILKLLEQLIPTTTTAFKDFIFSKKINGYEKKKISF